MHPLAIDYNQRIHQHRALRFLFARALRALLSFTTRRFDREALDIYSCPAHVRVHDALLPRPSASASLGVNYSEFLSYLLLLALINSLNCTQPPPSDRVCAAHDSQQGGSVVHTSAVKCYCLRQHINTLGVQSQQCIMHWLFVDRKLHSISMTEAIAYDRYCWAVVDDYPNEHRVDYVPVWKLLNYAWWCLSH